MGVKYEEVERRRKKKEDAERKAQQTRQDLELQQARFEEREQREKRRLEEVERLLVVLEKEVQSSSLRLALFDLERRQRRQEVVRAWTSPEGVTE